MTTKRALLERLNEQGLWAGTVNLKDQMKYAYQILGNIAFIGVFPKGTFKDVKDLGPEVGTLYLGRPSDLFTPTVGRDKIRTADGKLKVLGSIDELADIQAHIKKSSELVKIRPAKSVLMAYPLDHTRQLDIMIPAAFEGHNVHLVGAGVIGVELAVALSKMGLQKLTIYDPTEVQEDDTAVSVSRIFDPHRSRATVAYEIIADQTLQTAELQLRWPDSRDVLGNIVINTSDDMDVRRNLWNLVKSNPNIGLYLDVQTGGLRGKIFAIDTHDTDSCRLYTDELSVSDARSETIVYVVKILAGLAAGAVQRYVGTPGHGKSCCLDRVYFIDINEFYCSEGIWGKVGKPSEA